MFAEGSRVPLVNIRLCNDAAAQAIKQKMRNKSMKKRFGSIAVGVGYGVLFFTISIFGRTMICLGIVYALCLECLTRQKNICMTHLHIIQKQIRIATMYTRLH